MRIFRILLTVLISVATAASAAEAGVLVTPDRHILLLSPGESETVTYEIYNTGEEPLNIEVDPQDWGFTQVPVSSWLSIGEDKFEVGPEKSGFLEATVTVPKRVEGEQLAMLFLCYKEYEESTLNVRNGIPLYLVVKGTERYDAVIEGIEIEYTPAEDMVRPSLNIMVNVVNKGNIHIIPDVTVSVEDVEGKVVKTISQKGSKTLLRGRSNAYKFRLQDTLFVEGDYTIIARVDYEEKIEPIELSLKCSISDGGLKILHEDSGE